MRGRIGRQIGDANKLPVVPGPGTLAMNGWVDGGSYNSTLNKPVRLLCTQDGKNIYSTNVGTSPSHGITTFSRDVVSGALTRVDAFAPQSTGYAPAFLLESLDQKHIYCVAESSAVFNHYSRNATTGQLTRILTDTAIGVGGNSAPRSAVMAPDGVHFYATTRTDNLVYNFVRDGNSGSSTFGKLTALPGQTSIAPTGASQPIGIDITKNASSGIAGKYLYVGNFNNSTVCCLVRDNNSASGTYGQLSINPAQASTTVTVACPAWLKVTPDDRHLIVISDTGSGLTTVFTINQSDGSLTFLASYVGLNGGWAVDMTSDGAHVYVADSDGVLITQFSRDNNPASPNFGKLTAKVPAKVRACPYFTYLPTSSLGPNWVVVAPGDNHLYATPCNGNFAVPTFVIHK